MLSELQPDMCKLIDLVRQAENFDATVAASRSTRNPIEVAQSAWDERARKGREIVDLRKKWGI